MLPGSNIYFYYHSSEHLFSNDEMYLQWLSSFREIASGIFHIITFCLLPNSIEMMVEIKEEKELFENWKNNNRFPENETYESFQKMKNTFSLMGKNFIQTLLLKDIYSIIKKACVNSNVNFNESNFNIVNVDENKKDMVLNLHHQPIKAGLVTLPEQWKYSSYNAVLSQKPTSINRSKTLELFTSLNEFMQLHQSLNITLQSIK